MNRLEVLITLGAACLFSYPTQSFAQWSEYPQPRLVQFANGYSVTKEPAANSEVVKFVPGPTQANIGGTFRNNAGVIFYLSDWSWDRRASGQSHFWILPKPSTSAPAPAPLANGVQILTPPRELSFPSGFAIVENPSRQSKQISTKGGPLTANIKAYLDRDGIRFYMSDWSYERSQEGKAANWMRPLGSTAMIPSAPAPNPASPKTPKLPPGLEYGESEHEYVFAAGYDLVATPSTNATPVQSVTDPQAVDIVGEAWGEEGTYRLSKDQNLLRLQGKPFLWMRERGPKPRPDLLPRMKQIAGDYEFRFGPESNVDCPWRVGVELMSYDKDKALVALKEFGVEPYLIEIAPRFGDIELPFEWMREAAKFLDNTGALNRSITTLRNHLPKQDEITRIYAQSGEAEMMVGYTEEEKEFNIRFIAVLEAQRGNFAAVETLLSPLLQGWNPENDGLNASGPRINMLRELARAQWKQGKLESAKVNTRLWLNAYTRDVANDLLHPDYVDASQRVMEFDNDFESIGEYFDLLEAVSDPNVAAEMVVGLKGLQLAVTSSQQIRNSSHSDPEIAALSKELNRLNEEEQRSDLAGNAPDQHRKYRISDIHSDLAMRRLSGANLELAKIPEWKRLSAEINRRLRAGEDEFDVRDVVERRDLIALDHLITEGNFIADPKAVARKLRKSEILVDYFELPPATFGGESEYGAVVISQNAPIQLIRLGRAELINGAVKTFRDLMQEPGPFTEPVLQDLDDETTTILQKCHRLMIAPLLPHLKNAEHLIICPEGQLLFLPFDSLKSKTGESIGDRWEVTYVNAARDLMRRRVGSNHGQKTALLVGNPNFRSTRPSASRSASSAGGLSFDSRSIANLAEASRGIEFAQLPGTQEEITKLSPKLAAAGFRVDTLSGEDATEFNLTNRNNSPTILHFATHGFFLNELPVANRSPGDSKSESAMLLSGLALTGAQNTLEAWNQGRIPSPATDGIFLASEVSRLDLSGTGTVILSACETAVGKALSGEGVEGLRSGLTLAGAESVVLTLWPVDDNATVEVMDIFYSKILSGTPSPIAMAETKRELFAKTAKTEGEYIAQRFIGPFIVTRSGGL